MVPGAGVPAGPPRARLPAVSVAPLVNVMVPVLPALPLLPIAIAPDTASVEPPEKVSVPELVVVAADPSCRLAQAEAALTVTVHPRSMVTVSPATGNTPAPAAAPPEVVDQVVLAFQLPVAME